MRCSPCWSTSGARESAPRAAGPLVSTRTTRSPTNKSRLHGRALCRHPRSRCACGPPAGCRPAGVACGQERDREENVRVCMPIMIRGRGWCLGTSAAARGRELAGLCSQCHNRKKSVGNPFTIANLPPQPFLPCCQDSPLRWPRSQSVSAARDEGMPLGSARSSSG